MASSARGKGECGQGRRRGEGGGERGEEGEASVTTIAMKLQPPKLLQIQICRQLSVTAMPQPAMPRRRRTDSGLPEVPSPRAGGLPYGRGPPPGVQDCGHGPAGPCMCTRRRTFNSANFINNSTSSMISIRRRASHLTPEAGLPGWPPRGL